MTMLQPTEPHWPGLDVLSFPSLSLRINGREEGRKGGREEGRKGGREAGREGGREGGREEGRGRKKGYLSSVLNLTHAFLCVAENFWVTKGIAQQWVPAEKRQSKASRCVKSQSSQCLGSPKGWVQQCFMPSLS